MKERITIPSTPKELMPHPTGKVDEQGNPEMTPELSFFVFVEHYASKLVGFMGSGSGACKAHALCRAIESARPGEKIEISHETWKILNEGLENPTTQTPQGGTIALFPPFNKHWLAAPYIDAIAMAERVKDD